MAPDDAERLVGENQANALLTAALITYLERNGLVEAEGLIGYLRDIPNKVDTLGFSEGVAEHMKQSLAYWIDILQAAFVASPSQKNKIQ